MNLHFVQPQRAPASDESQSGNQMDSPDLPSLYGTEEAQYHLAVALIAVPPRRVRTNRRCISPNTRDPMLTNFPQAVPEIPVSNVDNAAEVLRECARIQF